MERQKADRGQRTKIRDTWSNTNPGHQWFPSVAGYDRIFTMTENIDGQMRALKGRKY
jgi:hypothetical protein